MPLHLAEISLLGIAVEPVVPMLILAIIPTEIARRILVRLRVGGVVWNWPLMVFAIYVLIVSVLVLSLRPL